MYDKLLVLDLDECLVHSTTRHHRFPNPDYTVGDYVGVHRPHLTDFLLWARTNFQYLGIWTASGRAYANEVIRSFAPPMFDLVWTRDRCTQGYSPVIYKDLKKLRRAGFAKERIIAVDDKALPWSRSYGNLVHMPAFKGDPEDAWLPKLQEFLAKIGDCENVREQSLRDWWA